MPGTMMWKSLFITSLSLAQGKDILNDKGQLTYHKYSIKILQPVPVTTRFTARFSSACGLFLSVMPK